MSPSPGESARASPGPLISLLDYGIEIPGGILELASFREWAHSASFPTGGRIDWIAGRLELDLSPKDLNTHGSPKSSIAGALVARIQERDRGLVFIDRARVTNSEADLSAEPDVTVLLFATVESGAARLVPKASAEEGRFVEIEGRVDLVVECISDSSKTKDRDQLPGAHFNAGVLEYWIVDARRNEVSLDVLVRGAEGYRTQTPDDTGFSRSEVVNADVRLVRRRERAGLVVFRLEIRDPASQASQVES